MAEEDLERYETDVELRETHHGNGTAFRNIKIKPL